MDNRTRIIALLTVIRGNCIICENSKNYFSVSLSLRKGDCAFFSLQRAENVSFVLSSKFFSYYIRNIYLESAVAKRICFENIVERQISKPRSIILQLFSIFNLSQRIFSRRQPSGATTKRPRYAIPRKWNADVPTFEQPRNRIPTFLLGILIRQGWYFKSISSCLRLTLLALSVHPHKCWITLD